MSDDLNDRSTLPDDGATASADFDPNAAEADIFLDDSKDADDDDDFSEDE